MMVSRIPRARSEINPPKLRNSILMSKLLHGLLHLVSGTKVLFDAYPLYISRAIRKDRRYTVMEEWRIHIICVGGPKLSCFSTRLLYSEISSVTSMHESMFSPFFALDKLLIWTFVARILLSLLLSSSFSFSPPIYFILPQRV